MAWQHRRVLCSTRRTLQTSKPHLPGVHCKSPSPATSVVSARHLPFSSASPFCYRLLGAPHTLNTAMQVGAQNAW